MSEALCDMSRSVAGSRREDAEFRDPATTAVSPGPPADACRCENLTLRPVGPNSRDGKILRTERAIHRRYVRGRSAPLVDKTCSLSPESHVGCRFGSRNLRLRAAQRATK